MRNLRAFRFASFFAALAFSSALPTLQAQSGGCDDIARDVSSAIQKDPSKALMIVEDALVINESCACEIIKAAIAATRADSAMVNQIVQTGIAVAPKMSGVIMDCATSVSPNASITPTSYEVVEDSGKNPSSEKNPVKNPLPVAPVEDEDFALSPSLRGVYLIQPPATGFIPYDRKKRKCQPNPTSPCYCAP